MAEFGISYDRASGALIVGDVGMGVPGRWQRFLLGAQNVNLGNPAQWDARATTWARGALGRDDVSVHVVSATPAPPVFEFSVGDPNPPAAWWQERPS